MDNLHIGRGITRGAMTVFPIWNATYGHGRYSLTGRHLDVTEVDAGPQVDTLMVGNVGDRPALVFEGQLFEGGWQHRMATRSIVVGVHQRVPVAGRLRRAGTLVRWPPSDDARTARDAVRT